MGVPCGILANLGPFGVTVKVGGGLREEPGLVSGRLKSGEEFGLSSDGLAGMEGLSRG